MTKRERAVQAVERLKALYPQAKCSLEAFTPLQLLIATRLSAQCTDARVNLVTPVLFKRYPDAEALANAAVEDVSEIIKSCGLYKTKAKEIVGIARMVRDVYGGTVPDTVEELTRLPGVGRKTANLICGDVYGKPAVVTDTHLIRIAGRIGLTAAKDPYKVEMELKKLLPPEESNDFCHRVVQFGRDVCNARKPACEGCPLTGICLQKGVKTGGSLHK